MSKKWILVEDWETPEEWWTLDRGLYWAMEKSGLDMDVLAVSNITGAQHMSSNNYTDYMEDLNGELIEKMVKEEGYVLTRLWYVGGGPGHFETPYRTFFYAFWDTDRNLEVPRNIDGYTAQIISRLADVLNEKFPDKAFRYRAFNDLEVYDGEMKAWRKIAGYATGGVGKYRDLGGMTWQEQSSRAWDVMLTVPEKIKDKVMKEASKRVVSWDEVGLFPADYSEAGCNAARSALRDIFAEAFKRVFSIDEYVHIDRMPEPVVKYAAQMRELYPVADDVRGRSAVRRFKEIPKGTALGKSVSKVNGGPLLRGWVLRRGDVIEDLLITGSVHIIHPAPMAMEGSRDEMAFEMIERALRGRKIDESAIRAKVKDIFDRGKIEIGLGTDTVVANAIVEACKLSYESPIKQA